MACGGRTYDKCKTPGVPAIFVPTFGHKTVHICDLSKLGKDYKLVYRLVNRKAQKKFQGYRTTTFIDTFAVGLIHEFQHYLYYHNWRSGKGPQAIAKADRDQDGVPDHLEPGLKFDAKKLQTYFGKHVDLKKIGGDEEWMCYEAVYGYQPGGSDKYDWSHPGKQWK